MLQFATDPSKFVYHYTKASTALNFILRDRRLLLSTYAKTNDPKEYRNWHFDIGTNGGKDLGRYDPVEISDWLTVALKQTTRMICFALDSDLTGDFIDDLFKRGFSRPRMWDQYGDRHQGVCLVFDKQKLGDLVRKYAPIGSVVVAHAVRYVDPPVIRTLGGPQPFQVNVDVLDELGRDAYAKLHLSTYLEPLFFEKMNDWRDEREFRWVVFGAPDGELFVPFEDALVAIMFGDSTSDKMTQDIIDLTEPMNLSYMGLKWRNSGPFYDGGNLRYVRGIKGTHWATSIKPV